jgi:Ca2+-binding EF-hand superfamily protein
MGEPQMRGAEMGDHHRSRRAEHMTRLYDTNGDGMITLGEINADQARMFTALDVDGDGSMSVDEIKRRGRSLQIFRTTTLFDLLDTNGDGKLSVAEIQAPSKRWFNRYDKNANGVLEADELPEGHRRGGRHGRRR